MTEQTAPTRQRLVCAGRDFAQRDSSRAHCRGCFVELGWVLGDRFPCDHVAAIGDINFGVVITPLDPSRFMHGVELGMERSTEYVERKLSNFWTNRQHWVNSERRIRLVVENVGNGNQRVKPKNDAPIRRGTRESSTHRNVVTVKAQPINTGLRKTYREKAVDAWPDTQFAAIAIGWCGSPIEPLTVSEKGSRKRKR